MTPTLNVTPEAKSDPAAAIANVPRPATFTTTDDGTQPAVSAYLTRNTMVVPGGPPPGEALPALRSIWWDAPLHDAAAAGTAVDSRSAAATITDGKARFMGFRRLRYAER